MAKAKEIIVQAKVNGDVVFDKTVIGKKHWDNTIRECMLFIDGIGGDALIRTQTVGAKGWGFYTYTAGDKAAVPCRAEW